VIDNNAPRDPIAEHQEPGDTDDDLLARIAQWDKQLEAHWSGWTNEARESFNFAAGRQWLEDEEVAMQNEGKIPAVFNFTGPTIDAVVGAQIQNRQKVQYFPRNVGASVVDDILSQGADWINTECDGDQEDTDAFRDCLICGIGWTETRPDYDMEARISKQRIDPFELQADPSSTKPNFADATYIRRKRKMTRNAARQWAISIGLDPDTVFETYDDLASKRPVIVDPTIRYTGVNSADEGIDADDVMVREYQWFDRIDGHLIPDPESGVKLVERAELEELLKATPNLKSTRIDAKRFRKAFVVNATVLDVQDIDVQDFTYKAITGKRDQTKGWWYGLVRPMLQPQKWANKLFSQILYIMRTNANGGLMIEEDAVLDMRAFEETWADPSKITWVKSGGLSNPNGARMQNKPQVQYPAGLDKLMEFSINSIRNVTGINLEMLGLADREQAGVLEYQRKQAAYGILNTFFDAFRRYLRMQGRLMLALIGEYMPEDKLVRVIGKEGKPEYVQLALSDDVANYDVIVDEAPSGPTHKMQTFQVLQAMLPLLSNADLPTQFWIEFARYSPLPGAFAEKIAEILTNQEKAAQAAAPQQQAMAERAALADIGDKEASANQKNASAQATLASAGREEAVAATEPVQRAVDQDGASAKAALDRAKTAQIIDEIINPEPEPRGPSAND
jgi:hypothetical protein